MLLQNKKIFKQCIKSIIVLRIMEESTFKFYQELDRNLPASAPTTLLDTQAEEMIADKKDDLDDENSMDDEDNYGKCVLTTFSINPYLSQKLAVLSVILLLILHILL